MPYYIINSATPPTSIESYATTLPEARNLRQSATERAARHHDRQARFNIITPEHFDYLQRLYVLSLPVHEISEQQFRYALEVLPPYAHGHINGNETFFMSEFDFGLYTTQYAHIAGKFYSSTANPFDKSTWIHHRLTHLSNKCPPLNPSSPSTPSRKSSKSSPSSPSRKSSPSSPSSK